MQYLGIHFVIDNELFALLPVSVSHGLGCSDDMLTHRLWRTDEGLALARSQLLVVRLGNHATAGVKLMRRHVGDLHEHGRDEVDTLEHLQVDVHVEWDLALFLNLLLLGGTLVVTLRKIF